MKVVSPAGFEPTAPGLGILCSILLSYGDGAACVAWGQNSRKGGGVQAVAAAFGQQQARG